MKYRVAFRERTNAEGEHTENPPSFLEPHLQDGVILDAAFVERTEPLNMHVQDVMDEDDDFLSIGVEQWEFEVAEGRNQEFIDALRNSQMLIEFHEMDDEMIAS